MIDRKIISRDELCDLVASVLEYNKITATEFAFFDSEGQPILFNFELRIAYESAPLRVRIVPEDENDVLKTSMKQAYGMVEQWRKERQQKSDPTTTQLTMSEVLSS